jgi:hypothetical protein
MIDQKTRIVNQLLSTIHVDKKDPSVIRLDMNNAASILSKAGYNLPAQQFESNLDELLSKRLIGKAKVTGGIKYSVAEMILALAIKMHIDEATIIKYITENQSEEDVMEMHNKVAEWRKDYYGNMEKTEKEALLESLHDKLRPDVLDQIRKS